jgi:hypothetical protein
MVTAAAGQLALTHRPWGKWIGPASIGVAGFEKYLGDEKELDKTFV